MGAKGAEFSSRVPAETSPATLERCDQLQVAFAELKTDMTEEVGDVERKLIIPAKIARDALKPMEKAIKKREDRKARLNLFISASFFFC
jgi:amphiphysin